MSSRKIPIMQNLFDGENFALIKVPTTIIKEDDITTELLAQFNHPGYLGISPGYTTSGRLSAIAIADADHCLIIEFKVIPLRRYRGDDHQTVRNHDNLKLLQDEIFCRSAGDLYAFDMGPLAMSLYSDAGLRITNAVDLQSGASAVDRKPLTVIKAIMGSVALIMEKKITSIFEHPEYKKNDRDQSATELAMRAWVSQVLPSDKNAGGAETFDKISKIDTLKLSEETLGMIAKLASDQLRLDQLKPTTNKHNFSRVINQPGDPSIVNASAYKDKFRPGQRIRATVQQEGRSEYVVRAQVDNVAGKSGFLTADRPIEHALIKSITSIGRDDPTTAEAYRSATVLRILQGAYELLSDSPWIKNIWFPTTDEQLTWPEDWSKSPPPIRSEFGRSSCLDGVQLQPKLNLNSSQQDAVNTMCSCLDSHRITIVQGPPGTGKTSVIAAFVQIATFQATAQDTSPGIWLVAQSNVAVKNIAEKLAAIGFLEWKLLVSKDFHFQWHEHIYGKVQDKVIRSDRFSKYPSDHLRDCKVILCTLSMLSNYSISKFIHYVPMKTLVVDEASQIETGNYIPIFTNQRFCSTLRKTCFIGDDKQLPPFGQEDLQDLQSIFEISHLRKYPLFLNTQYRMPPQLGDIISEAVYEGKLKSNPEHPISRKSNSCWFIDAPGKEKAHGDSYANNLECESAIKLAEKLQDQDKLYQIITPYEGQRSLIEEKMKETGLVWENKCFNVDSFQGNEEDYIVISLVRSWGLGFLDNLRRTNVMLTRCKKGMFIISSKNFLSKKGSTTLVGTLLNNVGEHAWLELKDIEDINL